MPKHRKKNMESNYKAFIEENLLIIDKSGNAIPFVLNAIQEQYLTIDATGRDIILKARQQGFSSLILAKFTADFLLKDNSVSVVVADNADNAIALLERVKFYLTTYEDITGVKVPLKYNSKYELHNEALNSKYVIGTAENTEFGRSRTITNLHMSEAAFYPHFRKLLAGVLQAVVPDGWAVVETTANGFNEFREYWIESTLGNTPFATHFYKASDFYPREFLLQKHQELGREFAQEYPESAEEAFLTSGASFFDVLALKQHMEKAREPLQQDFIY